MIRDKHMIAFLLTFVDDFEEIAKSIIVSLRAATSKSGTIVAINDKAKD
jgi:hypothetical protein